MWLVAGAGLTDRSAGQVFIELAKADGDAILQRDNEDAEKLARSVLAVVTRCPAQSIPCVRLRVRGTFSHRCCFCRGIDISIEKGVLQKIDPAPYTQIDVLGKTADEVADEIIQNLGPDYSGG